MNINTGTDTGLMTSAGFPAASLSSMSYDAESQPLGYAEHITGSSPDTVSMTYTDRGELLTDSRDPYPAPGAYPPAYANGLRIAGDAPQVTLGWDARRGVLNGAVNPENSDAPVYGYAYDIAGRQTSYTKVITNRQQLTCDEVTTRQYDAENRIIAGGQSPFLQTSCLAAGHYVESYDWGPNGHPARIGSAPSQYPSQIVSDTLHWDGDQLLFTTNAQGQVDDIKIGDQADITPKDPTFTGLTFWDHFDGTLAFCHNSSGSAGSDTNGARISSQWTGNVLGCLNNGAQTMHIPSSEIFSGDLDPPLWSNFKGVGQGGILGMARSDGIEDGFNVIQGVRTYDPSAGTWTTPDAYAGDVHDPRSQKAYMWNRDNPLLFSDPNGFDSIYAGYAPANVGEFMHSFVVIVTEAGDVYTLSGLPLTKFGGFLETDVGLNGRSLKNPRARSYDTFDRAHSVLLEHCSGSCPGQWKAIAEYMSWPVAGFFYAGVVSNSNTVSSRKGFADLNLTDKAAAALAQATGSPTASTFIGWGSFFYPNYLMFAESFGDVSNGGEIGPGGDISYGSIPQAPRGRPL